MAEARDELGDDIGLEITRDNYADDAGYQHAQHILLFAPLPDAVYRTYMVISALCRDSGKMWWSVGQIAKLRGCAARTVRRHILILCACRLITRTYREPINKVNQSSILHITRLECVFSQDLVNKLHDVLWTKRGASQISVDELQASYYAAVGQHIDVAIARADREEGADKNVLGGGADIYDMGCGQKCPGVRTIMATKEPIEKKRIVEREIGETAVSYSPSLGVPGGYVPIVPFTDNAGVRKAALARDRAAKKELKGTAQAAVDSWGEALRKKISNYLWGYLRGQAPPEKVSGVPRPDVAEMYAEFKWLIDIDENKYTPADFEACVRWAKANVWPPNASVKQVVAVLGKWAANKDGGLYRDG
jgi:hypothetical protein